MTAVAASVFEMIEIGIVLSIDVHARHGYPAG
jgi:hypothetical protein